MENKACAICNQIKSLMKRYLNIVCSECINKYGTKTIDGLSIEFSNEHIFGGFCSKVEGQKKSQEHICYINGYKCYASEARFGSIVIQLYKKKIGGKGGLPPNWILGKIEAPKGTKDMGTWISSVYTDEQQKRLGVDERGDKI